jgi:hypothetical protein
MRAALAALAGAMALTPAWAADAPCAGCFVIAAQVRPLSSPSDLPATSPACAAEASGDFARTVLSVIATRVAPAAGGNLVDAARTLPPALVLGLIEEVGMDFRPVLALPGDLSPYASCMPVGVLLPAGAEVVATQVGGEGKLVAGPVTVVQDGRGAVIAVVGGGPAELLVTVRTAAGAAPAPLR